MQMGGVPGNRAAIADRLLMANRRERHTAVIRAGVLLRSHGPGSGRQLLKLGSFKYSLVSHLDSQMRKQVGGDKVLESR